MQKKTIILSISAVLLIVIGGYFLFKYRADVEQNQVVCTMEAKLCPDGSFVGRSGPNCEFANCLISVITYINSDFGFELTLLDSWKGYMVEQQDWQGWDINTGENKYSGIKLVIKNPQTTASQLWQDIPIMIFANDVWDLIVAGKVSISAAPIPPAKIGESIGYIFATPPRWYGFTDAIGWEEAETIIKTFKAF